MGQPGRIQWTPAELELFYRCLAGRITKQTLYLKLNEINPARSYESMGRKLRQMIADGHEYAKDVAYRRLRVGYLDIETTGLEANFDFMVTWFIKYKGRDKFASSVITKEEIFSEKFDKRLVVELFEALENFDVVWTHYGSDRRFDVPFIRSRALIHGMDNLLPLRDEKFVRDTWLISRAKLKLSNNRLATIADALGLEDRVAAKTPISGRTWCLARAGNKKALKYIKGHNKADVILLERVADRLEPLVKQVYRSI